MYMYNAEKCNDKVAENDEVDMIIASSEIDEGGSTVGNNGKA